MKWTRTTSLSDPQTLCEIQSDQHDGRVCRIYSGEGTNERKFLPEQAENSARLILAAPALLDTVRDLLELHIAHHNHPTHAAARELIRKATGDE
jgi:hypothetical protein